MTFSLFKKKESNTEIMSTECLDEIMYELSLIEGLIKQNKYISYEQLSKINDKFSKLKDLNNENRKT
jgi:hypothetical protein